MSDIKKYEPTWVSKDMKPIPIKFMATSHLLNTIHMIERSRMQQLMSIETHGGGISPEEAKRVLDYYCAWPKGYSDLLAEAEKRQLIRRK
jgi:hypothetical protein